MEISVARLGELILSRKKNNTCIGQSRILTILGRKPSPRRPMGFALAKPAVGIRFHRTILEEFYQIAFRTKVYSSVEKLQSDVDDWIDSYNCNRPHSGRYCYGKTPMQTFLDSKAIVRQKMLDRQYEDKMGDEMKNKQEHGEKIETNETYLTSIVSVR